MSQLYQLKLGLLEGVQYIPSPNYNHRPDGIDIDMIVIHNISLPPGKYDSNDVIDFFTNQLDVTKDDYYQLIAHNHVSAHFFIRRNGDLIQFVPTHERAWHAGASAFRGRTVCNDFSIGIELEGSDFEAFEESQYVTLIKLIKTLQHYYPAIVDDHIVGHSDISPGRKTDPGSFFDWTRIKLKRVD